MVALFVMAVGMVGVLQAAAVALDENLRNQMREGALYLGEKYMNDLRGKRFESYSSSYGVLAVAGTARGGAGSYLVARSVIDLCADGSTKELQVTVSWTFKGVSYRNRVVSTISQPVL